MKSTEMWPPDVCAPKPSYVTKRRASGTPCWISACMHADARKYVSQAYGAPVPPPGEVAAFGAAGGGSLYPSMNPSAMGARPGAR